MKAFGIIVAGGQGKRMCSEVPKQLMELGGITILERTLKPFLTSPDITGLIITAHDSIIDYANNLTQHLDGYNKPITVVHGGKERQDSVYHGLEAVPGDTGIVVIHDAVRPFITCSVIHDCVVSALRHGAVTVARPLKETVKIVENINVVTTLNRSSLFLTQTPQAFRTELIRKAHETARRDCFIGTDDCMLVERLGHPVAIVEGSDMNIKITTPADLVIAGALLSLFEHTEG